MEKKQPVQAGDVLHAFYAIEQDNGQRCRELVKIDCVRMDAARIIIIVFHLIEFIIKKTTTTKNRLECLRVATHSIEYSQRAPNKRVRAILVSDGMRVLFFCCCLWPFIFMCVSRSVFSFFLYFSRFIVDSLLLFYWINIKLPSIDSEWSPLLFSSSTA